VDNEIRILRVIPTFQIISLRRYRDKLLDFTVTESEPKITFEPTPTRTNDVDMSNIVHNNSGVGSNLFPSNVWIFPKKVVSFVSLLLLVFSATELAFLDLMESS
jgi:hypothetical protein